MQTERHPIVVIGAGMAGLTAARRLAAHHDVIVLDKGRGVGGRMATRRIGDATFDHGAQFMTAHTDEFAAVLTELVGDGVVAPWFRGRVGPDGATDHDGHDRFRGAVSMNAVAKHLASGLDVRTGAQVASIEQSVAGWIVRLADGSHLDATAILCTAPVPQTLALLDAGDVELSGEDRAALEAVEYDPCIAVMAVLDAESGLPAPGAIDPETGPIDWIADNAIKGISTVPCVTIHADAEFSLANWDAPDEQIAQDLLAAADLSARMVDGGLSVQRWRYARPSVEHPARALMPDLDSPFVCAGDAFGGAKVEGAMLSGAEAARILMPQ